MNLIHRYFYLIAIICFGLVALSPTHSRWKPEYAKMPPGVRAWYQQAQTMPDSTPRKKHGWIGCCAHADVVEAQFEARKVNGHYREDWYYKTDGMTEFKKIPNDIIHYGEAAPYGLPTLFIYQEEEVCFWPPNGSI